MGLSEKNIASRLYERVDTAPPLPNFLIVGVAKCGTTSLYHYLREDILKLQGYIDKDLSHWLRKDPI